MTGLNWLSADIFIGSCGIQLLKPLATSFLEWYERQAGGERYVERMMEVMLEAHDEGLSMDEMRERLEQYQHSMDLQQHLESCLYV